jgi:lysophospholipase L1-like esterase
MRSAAQQIGRSLAALALLAALACGRAAAPPPESESAPRAVFFGSSTTVGAGASEAGRRWTALVSARLGWTEVNRGLGGSTLAERGGPIPSAERRWREAVVAARPDVVVVQYGANDVLSAVPLGGAAEPGTFRHGARAVLGGLREALPGVPLVVVEPQPAPGTAGTRAAYDAALAEAALEAGATLVRAGQAFPAGEHAVDHIHVDDGGHAALAAHVAGALAAALGDPGQAALAPRLAVRAKRKRAR